ncbi:uncharacterized protein LOC130222672 [Danio aesculapii]|uniref:uncharacterized protein LOC130222672 n=1 Tax=Danio aesculapii TaxID=1142201 RepID=UPI0024C0D945|nr:uncharacterized protein LOC130222672 [Danio aesculapii]
MNGVYAQPQYEQDPNREELRAIPYQSLCQGEHSVVWGVGESPQCIVTEGPTKDRYRDGSHTTLSLSGSMHSRLHSSPHYNPQRLEYLLSILERRAMEDYVPECSNKDSLYHPPHRQLRASSSWQLWRNYVDLRSAYNLNLLELMWCPLPRHPGPKPIHTIREILDFQRQGNLLEYLIDWEGYGPGNDPGCPKQMSWIDLFWPTQTGWPLEVMEGAGLGHQETPLEERAEKPSRENSKSNPAQKGQSCEKSLSVAHEIKNNWSSKIADGSNETLPIFKLQLEKTWKNSDGFCRRCTFGKNSTKENKTIMMIGATGSGKTTLINSMINYILGVNWEDDFRFVLIDEGQQKSQAESQTSEITAYQINHMDGFRVPYSLTIVDTPGFGDTRGIKQDQKITGQILEFFSAPGGIDCIDAVCFVVQASLARLTHTQKYVFDSILSIFGKDIAENILMMVTFADGKKPPVLEAIIKSEIPCSTDESGKPLQFKFNNSAVFANNNKSTEDEDSDCENFDQMFWKLGFSSMNKFFTSLSKMETKSLTLTREVLKERKQLEVLVEGLQPQINAGLTKLDEIRKTRAALEQNKAKMEANKDFEYELEVTVPKQIENTSNYYLTNCQKCNFTCHDSCIIPNDSDKHGCCAMKDGNCTVCPGKCVWNVHFNQKYKWDYVTEKRKETYHDLKERYKEAYGEVMTKEKIFEKLEYELEVVQDIVTGLIKDSQKSLERLQEIALKPNPLSTPDYIDLMIESEKQEAKPGFTDRIQSLMEVKVKAEIISKVSTGGAVPEDLKKYKPETSRNKPERSRIISFSPFILFRKGFNFLKG